MKRFPGNIFIKCWFLTSFIIGSVSLPCLSQDCIWYAGYQGFFDNREYFNEYVSPQTMFGSRISAYTGFSLSSTQEFVVGLHGLYEFGDKLRTDAFEPILFYHFKNKFVDLFLGACPRRNLIALPDFLLSDTLQYYRPNLEGIYLEFYRDWGFQNVWLDWTSRQTNVARETFKIGGTGMLHKGLFYYRHDFIMTHFAGPAIPIPNDHIRDNGGLYSGLGLDLSRVSAFDSLTVSSGLCFSYDRVRNVYELRFYSGSLTQIVAELKGFGIKVTTYFGDGQNQITGDGLYRAPLYNRFDFYWRIFRMNNIRGKVQFSLHLIENVLDTSQSFTIYASLDGGKKLNVIRSEM
jgi:hypothetical protein